MKLWSVHITECHTVMRVNKLPIWTTMWTEGERRQTQARNMQRSH